MFVVTLRLADGSTMAAGPVPSRRHSASVPEPPTLPRVPGSTSTARRVGHDRAGAAGRGEREVRARVDEQLHPWMIKPEQEAIDAFLHHWKTEALVQDRRGLVGA